jgi:hypothetical protein
LNFLLRRYNIWIHLEGSGLYLRALKKTDPKAKEAQKPPPATEEEKKLRVMVDVIELADSMLLNPYNLFGFPDDNKVFRPRH